jgi:Skp family chaperone for outer membrane proteins
MAMTSLATAQDTKAPARVAIVDLDAVAKAVGRDAVIRKQLETATQQLNQQLLKAAGEMKTQIEAEQKKLGDKPSEEDQKRVQQMLAAANQNVQNNKMVAQLRQQQLKNELIVQFRNEIRPIAEKAARAQGAAAVFVATDNVVLWFDPSLDITDEVIAEYRANPPKTIAIPTPPAPAEDGKPTIDAPKN